MRHAVPFFAAWAALAAGAAALGMAGAAPALAATTLQDADDDIDDDIADDIDDDVGEEIDDDVAEQIDDELDDELDDDIDDDIDDDVDRDMVRGAAAGLSGAERLDAAARRSIAFELERDAEGAVEREWAVLAARGNAAALRRAGFDVLERRAMRAIGGALYRVRAPASLDAETIARRLRAIDPDAIVDRNHLYAPQADGAPATSPADLAASIDDLGGEGLVIGVIDGGADRRHPALRRADIETAAFLGGGRAAMRHGTSVLSVLVGESPGFRGLAPKAKVRLASALVETSGGAQTATVAGLVASLDWLAASRTPVVLMSLAGPPNALLERAVATARDRGAVLVAAVGNRGPAAAPLYPSAYDGVLGVSAVDASGVPYRLSGRGPHVDFAAPGVGVRAAEAGGGFQSVSGTSLAAPFVAASVCALRREHASAADAVAALAARVEDLGAPGRDPVYGFGSVGRRAASERSGSP